MKHTLILCNIVSIWCCWCWRMNQVSSFCNDETLMCTMNICCPKHSCITFAQWLATTDGSIHSKVPLQFTHATMNTLSDVLKLANDTSKLGCLWLYNSWIMTYNEYSLLPLSFLMCTHYLLHTTKTYK